MQELLAHVSCSGLHTDLLSSTRDLSALGDNAHVTLLFFRSCSGCPCCAGMLQDTKGAVGKLEMIFALLIHSLACLAYLAIFNVSHTLSLQIPVKDLKQHRLLK